MFGWLPTDLRQNAQAMCNRIASMYERQSGIGFALMQPLCLVLINSTRCSTENLFRCKMPITTTTSPYLFTIVVLILGSACFYLPSLLLLAVFFLRPSNNSSPSDAGAFTAERQRLITRAGEVADIPAALRSGPAVLVADQNAGGEATAECSSPCNEGGGSNLRASDGRSVGGSLKYHLDLIDDQFRLNNKTPADVYPANKIAVKCKECRSLIGAGDGYKHYNVGIRGTFCRGCHLQKGLPLRDDDGDKNVSSAIMDGEGVSNEV